MQVLPVGAAALSGAAIVTTTELLIISTPGLIMSRDTAQVFVCASVNIAPGTAATSIQLRIRRGLGALTDTAVFSSGAINQIVVGQDSYWTISGLDTVPAGSQPIYSLTVQQAGATGNGSFFNAQLAALLFF